MGLIAINKKLYKENFFKEKRFLKTIGAYPIATGLKIAVQKILLLSICYQEDFQFSFSIG